MSNVERMKRAAKLLRPRAAEQAPVFVPKELYDDAIAAGVIDSDDTRWVAVSELPRD